MMAMMAGSNLRALEAWKKKRRAIVEELVKPFRFAIYEPFAPPSNHIRSHERRSLADIAAGIDQERVLFEDFIAVCRGENTPHLQCEMSEEKVGDDADDSANGEMTERLEWRMPVGCSPLQHKWMRTCFHAGTNLFELELCISRIRADMTRGPTVATFCSVVSKHLRKQLYPLFEELDKMEAKNLLSLQRQCATLNEWLEPLREVARVVEERDLVGGELLNFLCEESQADRCVRIADLLKQTFALALKRYFATLHEWISQAELTLDLGYEFFVWDLARVNIADRAEFAPPIDGATNFDKRFVVVEELVPEVLKPVAKKIVETAAYLYTMKEQKADFRLYAEQIQLDGDAFRGKSIGEVRSLIRQLHERGSATMLRHLNSKLSVCALASSLPHYFLSHRSSWMEHLVERYEEEGYAQRTAVPSPATDAPTTTTAGQLMTPPHLQQLLDAAMEADWLNGDAFRHLFRLKASAFHFVSRRIRLPRGDEETSTASTTQGAGQGERMREVQVPEMELHIDGEPTLGWAFPQKVLEAYRQMFRIAFTLRQARYLLCRKRFSPGFQPSRQECAALSLMFRFVDTYHCFVFDTQFNAAHGVFAKQLAEVKSLDELVDAQHDFLCTLCERARLDMEKKKLTDAILSIVSTFASYASDEIPFNDLNAKVGLRICKLKKMLLQGNTDTAELRQLLFGCNFINLSSNEADLEPLWVSLRHLEPFRR